MNQNFSDINLQTEKTCKTDTYLHCHVDAEGLRQLTRIPPGYENCKSFEVVILLPQKEIEDEKWSSLKDLKPSEFVHSLCGVLSAYKGSAEDLRAEGLNDCLNGH